MIFPAGVLRIVERDHVPVGVHILAHVAIAESVDRHGHQAGRPPRAGIRALIGKREERLIPAVKYVGNVDRAAEFRPDSTAGSPP